MPRADALQLRVKALCSGPVVRVNASLLRHLHNFGLLLDGRDTVSVLEQISSESASDALLEAGVPAAAQDVRRKGSSADVRLASAAATAAAAAAAAVAAVDAADPTEARALVRQRLTLTSAQLVVDVEPGRCILCSSTRVHRAPLAAAAAADGANDEEAEAAVPPPPPLAKKTAAREAPRSAGLSEGAAAAAAASVGAAASGGTLSLATLADFRLAAVKMQYALQKETSTVVTMGPADLAAAAAVGRRRRMRGGSRLSWGVEPLLSASSSRPRAPLAAPPAAASAGVTAPVASAPLAASAPKWVDARHLVCLDVTQETVEVDAAVCELMLEMQHIQALVVAARRDYERALDERRDALLHLRSRSQRRTAKEAQLAAARAAQRERALQAQAAAEEAARTSHALTVTVRVRDTSLTLLCRPHDTSARLRVGLNEPLHACFTSGPLDVAAASAASAEALGDAIAEPAADAPRPSLSSLSVWIPSLEASLLREGQEASAGLAINDLACNVRARAFRSLLLSWGCVASKHRHLHCGRSLSNREAPVHTCVCVNV